MDEAVRTLYPQLDKKHNSRRNGDGTANQGPRDSDKRKDRSGGTKRAREKKKKIKIIPPLNKSITTILKEIKYKPFFSSPERLKASVEIRNCSKRCKYHYDYGLEIEGFLVLKNFIEQQIKKGNMSYYVKR